MRLCRQFCQRIPLIFCCYLIGLLVLAPLSQVAASQDDHEHNTSEHGLDRQRSTAQQEGLRANPPKRVAIVGATVHRDANSQPAIETILIDGTKITSIGSEIPIPAGTRVIDATGHHCYPGLIDAYHAHEFELETEKKGTGYWNDHVRPQLRVADEFHLDDLNRKELREAGFTAALVAPESGVIQGQSSLLLLGGHQQEHAILAADIAQHFRLTVERGGRGGGYPNSPMGAYALARQALYDAQWYAAAWNVSAADPTAERPESNAALEALRPLASGQQWAIIETSNELFALRSDRFAREFGLRLAILGSGNEYRRLDEIAALGRPIILPVNFPNPPDVSAAEMADDVTLETMMHWDHAPENPGRLAQHNVQLAFTTMGLKKKDEFLKNVRSAVDRGLSSETALAAMTINPAKLYGVDHLVGTLEKNKLANLTITDGDLFESETRIVATWIDGVRFEKEPEPLRDVAGTWKLVGKGLTGQNLVVEEREGRLSAKILPAAQIGQSTDQKDPKTDEKTSEISVKPISLTGTRLTGAFRSDALGHDGISLFSLIISPTATATGQITLPNGKTIPVSATLATTDIRETAAANSDSEENQTEIAAVDAPSKDAEPKSLAASFPVNYPLGAYGRLEAPTQPKSVLIKNVTVWSLDESGKIENGAVLFGNGTIQSVFTADQELPEAETIIDGQGAHLTPGIIDCHSHMATDSGVNESGQAITAEVRIGDMIDCDDITIYRQLAGGVTAANILHGSANPIGGQNQVIKLRWGATEQAMKFADAPEGIKFALGENVKQSNWSNPTDRYPQTRMGVEQIIDDAFRAAKDYRRRQRHWEQTRTGLPPRKDLELEAIAEILEGTRWVHCHSYRQDEILALIRTLDQHNVTIGSFQHILEGYKVADEMAKHGAMGSAFADWWAYKYEVKDAIPYAGALMHRAGVVVSYNSDDAELGRHLNHEAAKAVRYGGVPEVEALKFVTLNPARQLRIESRVGSIESGKDADLVLWSGHPLSNLSVVQQTWVDGRKYFDRTDDAKIYAQMRSMRLALIQKILSSGEEMQKTSKDNTDPAKLWPRYDEFCHGHDHDHDGHDEHDHGGDGSRH